MYQVSQSAGGVKNRIERFRVNRMWFQITSNFALWSFLGVCFAWPQAAGEYGGVVSSMGSVGVGAAARKVPDKLPSAASAQAGSKAQPVGPQSKYLPAQKRESVEVRNRRELEKDAGEHAAKLLVRSDPSKASVLIDGKLVGNTPLLLILPPRQYKVEMRGSRLEFAQGQVDLLPKETREFELKLEQRYPSQVHLR